MTLVFVLLRLVPGDPAIQLAGEGASQQSIEKIRHELELDRPLTDQYLHFTGNLIHGSLGKSVYTNRDVAVELGERFPFTLALTTASTAVALVLGIALGSLAASQRGRPFDYMVTALMNIALAIPTFWLAALLILLFSLRLHWLPVVGAGTWQHLIMPTLALSTPYVALNARITRSSVSEEINQDYVRTALAKGLRRHTIMARHVLGNALIPVVTLTGLQFGSLLGGAFIVETIFAWPGIGQLAVQSIFKRDFPVIQGTVLFVATAYLVCNILVDVLYVRLDPRIRYTRGYTEI